jgi:class 3 adenylate cyclase
MRAMRYKLKLFLEELVLYSGQFALFYIVMCLVGERFGVDWGAQPLQLLALLVLQTLLITSLGSKPAYRGILSLITPLGFSILSQHQGAPLSDTVSFFFWAVSLYMGLLQAIATGSRSRRVKGVMEFFLCIGTALSFSLSCFLLDINVRFWESRSSGSFAMMNQLASSFTLEGFPRALEDFLSTPLRVYLIISAFIFAVLVAIPRVRVVRALERSKLLFSRAAPKPSEAEAAKNQGVGERRPQSESKDVAILYADIRSFAQASAKGTPQEIVDTLNLYFTAWEGLAEAEGGSIDKYLGDTVMIIFEPREGYDAMEACARAALAFQTRLKAIEDDLHARKLLPVRSIGIGLHFGEVVSGEIGGTRSRSRTVIGDAVNVASRMEALCREYKQQIIISDAAYSRLSIDLQTRFSPLGEILLKGKTESVAVYGMK